MGGSEVGPWAKDKLEHLRKYLHAYTTIMKEQKWCEGFYYIDAFAGPGKHTLRSTGTGELGNELLLDVALYGSEQSEQQEFLAGSPRIALEIEYPFTGYVFVEKARDRIVELRSLQSEYTGRRTIEVHEADCTEYLSDRVAGNSNVDWRTHRALIFLDPFGMQVKWDTIAALAATQAIEVFVNFPVGMAIQRLLPRDSTKLTPSVRTKLNEYFGTEEWYSVLYKRVKTLFDEDESEMEKIESSGVHLLEWYQKRLKDAFGYVSRAALIRNSKGGHLYYLLLASPNPTGVRIADEILSAGEHI